MTGTVTDIGLAIGQVRARARFPLSRSLYLSLSLSIYLSLSLYFFSIYIYIYVCMYVYHLSESDFKSTLALARRLARSFVSISPMSACAHTRSRSSYRAGASMRAGDARAHAHTLGLSLSVASEGADGSALCALSLSNLPLRLLSPSLPHARTRARARAFTHTHTRVHTRTQMIHTRSFKYMWKLQVCPPSPRSLFALLQVHVEAAGVLGGCGVGWGGGLREGRKGAVAAAGQCFCARAESRRRAFGR